MKCKQEEMNEQLYVIEILMLFIIVVLLAQLCVMGIFLQPVIVHRDTDYDSI